LLRQDKPALQVPLGKHGSVSSPIPGPLLPLLHAPTAATGPKMTAMTATMPLLVFIICDLLDP
jgi:hypothetical protein